MLETSVGDEPGPALRRLAGALAKEREVVVEPAAIERLLTRTDADPALFAAELEKLLDWAGKGGRVQAADVESNVEDEASEDVYGLFDAIGRRDAGDALARLERLFDGRDVRQGDRAYEKVEEVWPMQLLGLVTAEVRRMLLLRARMEEAGPRGFDSGMSYPAFQARILPRLTAPVAPFGRSPFEGARGPTNPYALYKAAHARVAVLGPGARPGPLARGRRGRAAEVVVSRARHAVGLRRRADRREADRGGARAPAPVLGHPERSEGSLWSHGAAQKGIPRRCAPRDDRGVRLAPREDTWGECGAKRDPSARRPAGSAMRPRAKTRGTAPLARQPPCLEVVGVVL